LNKALEYCGRSGVVHGYFPQIIATAEPGDHRRSPSSDEQLQDCVFFAHTNDGDSA